MNGSSTPHLCRACHGASFSQITAQPSCVPRMQSTMRAALQACKRDGVRRVQLHARSDLDLPDRSRRGFGLSSWPDDAR
eukprot:6172256-Pleurochrysis_carterae.AAC.5